MSSRLSPTDFDIVNARIDNTNQRHAELAALVSKLTIAVEALERKVESLVRLELEDAEVLPTIREFFVDQAAHDVRTKDG